MGIANSSKIFLKHLLFVCVYVEGMWWLHTCHDMWMVLRGQLVCVSSFLLPCEFQGSNAGNQTWWQLLLPADYFSQIPSTTMELLFFWRIIWRISENRKKNDYLHFSPQKVLSVLFVFQMFINCTVLIFVPGDFAVDI